MVPDSTRTSPRRLPDRACCERASVICWTDTKFAATGTADNKVLVWSMPDAASAKQDLAGTLTFTDSAVDAADRKARVWAELTNPGEDRLMPGDTVTLVIPLPETAKP